ncbi:hypothetical protein [Brachyspira hampsonii]|uniref:hypothetical protein n=1 Tax=Brachyspira hampsonii TaxID=1287055 RepID=UPI000345134A|nr:hypothetical protein [Brachyspira hampsonii]
MNGATKYPASLITHKVNSANINTIEVFAHIYFQNGIKAAISIRNSIIGLIISLIK